MLYSYDLYSETVVLGQMFIINLNTFMDCVIIMKHYHEYVQ